MTTTKRKLPSDYLAQGWCQGAYARNAAGKSARADAFEARAWCLYGAQFCTWLGNNIIIREAVALHNWLSLHGYTSEWNDAPSRTQAEVVAVMLEAEAAVLDRTTQEAV